MPDLPTSDASVNPQVQPSAELPMDATPQAFGAGVGEALESGAEVATKIHHDARMRANETMVLDAHNKNNAFIQERVYDPTNGILNKPLGGDAPKAADQVLSDFDQHTQKVMGGLVNDDQRISYQRLAQQQRFELERQLGAYAHRETTRNEQEVRQTSLANSVTAAVQNAGDGERVQKEIDFQKNVVADDGIARGLDPKTIKLMQQESASQTHASVIDQLLASGRDVDAKKWYDAHKGELTARDLETTTRKVDAGSTAAEATSKADEIVLDKDGNVDSREKIDARVRAITDPKLRDAVQERVNRRLEQHAQEMRENEEMNFRQAYTYASKIAQDPASDGLQDTRMAMLMSGLSPERQETLKRYFAKDGDVTTDPRVYQAYVLGMADPQTRKEWIGRDPVSDVDKLSSKDLMKLIDDRARYMRGDQTMEQEAQGTLTKAKAISNAIHTAALDDDKDAKNRAYDAIDQEVRAVETATGKKLRPDEIEKVGTALLVKRAYQGQHFYNFDKPAIDFTVDMVPADERRQIVEKANQQKHTPTDEEIVQAYLKQLGIKALASGQ